MLEFLIKLMQMCSIDCYVMVQPWETYEKHIRNTWILRPIYSSYRCQVSEPGCNIPTTITTVYFSEAKANIHHNHRSSIPPFLRSSPPVMLEDFKELRLWDIQEVLCNNKVTVIESSKVGHQGGDRIHSAYSQDVSEKSHQLTRCSFSLQKWIPLHSTCQIVVAWRLATFSRDLQVAKKTHQPSSWSNTPHLKVGRTGHKRWFPGEEAERSLEGNP